MKGNFRKFGESFRSSFAPADHIGAMRPGLMAFHLAYDRRFGFNGGRNQCPVKTSAFYRRACEDSAFRREKLDELRFLKVVQAGIFWSCLGFGVALSPIAGISEGRWSAHLTLFGSALFAGAVYCYLSDRFAALEAFEKSLGQTPHPNFEDGLPGRPS